MKRSRRIIKPWHWMSFCDPDKPEGGKFLGVAIVRARDEREALHISHMLKINPGGEVLTKRCPEDFVVPDNYKNRLLTRAECEEFRDDIKSIGELKREGI